METSKIKQMELMIVEVLSKCDLLTISPARELMLNLSTMNIITMLDSADIIKEFVFGKDSDSEALTNFIIKTDGMLAMNGFYTLFSFSYGKPKDSWFKTKTSKEIEFVITYMRLFMAIRFFAEVFILNLREDIQEGPGDE